MIVVADQDMFSGSQWFERTGRASNECRALQPRRFGRSFDGRFEMVWDDRGGAGALVIWSAAATPIVQYSPTWLDRGRIFDNGPDCSRIWHTRKNAFGRFSRSFGRCLLEKSSGGLNKYSCRDGFAVNVGGVLTID
jgi:hypothetical protein